MCGGGVEVISKPGNETASGWLERMVKCVHSDATHAQNISVKNICRIKAVSSRIASLGDEHDAIIAVWLHGLRQNEGEE